VRFSIGRGLAALAIVPSLFFAAVALGQQNALMHADSSVDPAQPLVLSSWLYPNAGGQEQRDAPVSPLTTEPKPGNSYGGGMKGGYGSQDYGSGSQCAACDECPRRGAVIFLDYNSWRGISDGSWQNNGINTGLNFGTRLGRFSDLTDIGFQIGGSVGAYNWAGTDYRISHQNEAQPQGFVTYGLFRKANEDSNWSAAVVQDWMLNSNFGVFAQNPTLSQWRGQLGYALTANTEVGVWGTWRAHGDTRDVPGFGSTSWRPINQLNVFAHYKWGPGGPDTAIWVGRPEDDRITGNGSLGDYTVGLYGNFPISDRSTVYTLVTYMHQSASLGGLGAQEDAWNFTVGMTFYPARNARSTTVAGQCWMPALPVANNGYFLVDTNHTF
jgi:hypothetical protein